MIASPLEIRNEILSYWSNNYTLTPTEYENLKLPDAQKADPYVSLEIHFTSSQSIIKAYGDDATGTRHRGVIFAEIIVHAGDGTSRQYEIADEICKIIERKRLGEVVTRNASLRPLNFGDDLSVLIVEIPFLST